MRGEFKTFCGCGRLVIGERPWAEHLRACPRMQDLLRMGKKPIEVRYPDLVVLRPPIVETTTFEKAGVPVLYLPSMVSITKDPMELGGESSVVVNWGYFVPTWAAVIKVHAPSSVAIRAMEMCMKDDGAVQALITLLRLAPDQNYKAAIKEFVGVWNTDAKEAQS